jgi:transposase InsO family protein
MEAMWRYPVGAAPHSAGHESDTGLDVRLTSRRQPWKNDHIERFIQTLKHLVLRKFIFHSENALREAIQVGLRHYNQERPASVPGQ